MKTKEEHGKESSRDPVIGICGEDGPREGAVAEAVEKFEAKVETAATADPIAKPREKRQRGETDEPGETLRTLNGAEGNR